MSKAQGGLTPATQGYGTRGSAERPRSARWLRAPGEPSTARPDPQLVFQDRNVKKARVRSWSIPALPRRIVRAQAAISRRRQIA